MLDHDLADLAQRVLLGGGEQVEQVRPHLLDVTRAASSSLARPVSVSSANEPRRSSAQARLRIQPAASRRATAWESRLREDSEDSASWLIRSVRSGASDSCTRIS